MERLRLSNNKRYLINEDGTPFCWVGDTAWELFHKLSLEEADYYLKTRASQGFTVIQAVLLSELNGIAAGNYYGKVPLKLTEYGYDPAQPMAEGKASYWDTADTMLAIAGKYNMYIALLPSWGDKWNLAHGVGPVIFDQKNAYLYGEFLGKRYKAYDNIIWVMGGDRDLHTEEHFRIIRAMAEGIKESGATQLMTMHPKGCTSSSYYFQQEDWLDFHMVQSSHGSRNYPNYKLIGEDYQKLPIKPVLEGEARYEDIAVGFQPGNGYFDEHDVRQSAYWAICSGSFGYTYGQNSIWAMIREKEVNDIFIMSWEKALFRPGGLQMQYLKKLLTKYQLHDRVPASQLIKNNQEGANHCTACRGDGYILVYSPNGVPFVIKEEINLTGIKVLHWFNPRNGEVQETPVTEWTGNKFAPPTAGRGQDWILIIRHSSIQLATQYQVRLQVQS